MIGLALFALLPLLYLPVFIKSRKSGSPVKAKKEIGHNFEIPAFSPTTAQILVTKKGPDGKALAGEIALRAAGVKLPSRQARRERTSPMPRLASTRETCRF